jgi:hypothetical protein
MLPFLIIQSCLLAILAIMCWALSSRISNLRKEFMDWSDLLGEHLHRPEPSIPSAEQIVKLLLPQIDSDFRCPDCKNLLIKGTKFCKHCGADLNKVKRARVLACGMDDNRNRYFVRWQCSECGEPFTTEWYSQGFKKRGMFIEVLRCTKCGHVGDLVVDSSQISSDRPWSVTAYDPGTAQLVPPKTLHPATKPPANETAGDSATCGAAARLKQYRSGVKDERT